MGSSGKRKKTERTLGRNVVAGEHKMNEQIVQQLWRLGQATCRTGESTAANAEEFAAQQPGMICTETG